MAVIETETRKENGGRRKKTPVVDAKRPLRLVEVMEPSAPLPQKSPTAPQPRVAVPSTSPNLPTSTYRKQKQGCLVLPEEGACTIRIIALEPQDRGLSMLVTLAIDAKEAEDAPKSCRQKPSPAQQVRVLMSSCREMALSEGDISPQVLARLMDADALYRGVMKCMTLLGYGSMSRRRLTQKLLSRGFDREVAEKATAYMAERGYLDEGDAALRFAQRGVAKLWGPRRIREDLFARGFSRDMVAETLETLDDVDFADQCVLLIEKKYGSLPKDANARRKMAAALMRLGYTSETISHAMKVLTISK